MKKRFSLFFLYFFILLFIMAGCTPSIKLPDPVPPTIKEHNRFSASQLLKGFKETGVYLDKGSLFTILMDKELERYCLSGRIGGQMVRVYEYYLKVPVSEQLLIGRSGGCYGYGSVSGLIIVWSEEDYGKITEFLEELRSLYPNNEDILTALDLAKSL